MGNKSRKPSTNVKWRRGVGRGEPRFSVVSWEGLKPRNISRIGKAVVQVKPKGFERAVPRQYALAAGCVS